MSGFKAYFNAETMNGRANVAKATYATIAVLYVFFKVRGKAKKDTCSQCELPQPPVNAAIASTPPNHTDKAAQATTPITPPEQKATPSPNEAAPHSENGCH